MGSMPRGVLLGCQNRVEGLSVSRTALISAVVSAFCVGVFCSVVFAVAGLFQENVWWQSEHEIKYHLNDSVSSDF